MTGHLRGIIGERDGSGLVFRKSNVHRCELPVETPYDAGDVFICDCGKEYELEPREIWKGVSSLRWVEQ